MRTGTRGLKGAQGAWASSYLAPSGGGFRGFQGSRNDVLMVAFPSFPSLLVFTSLYSTSLYYTSLSLFPLHRRASLPLALWAGLAAPRARLLAPAVARYPPVAAADPDPHLGSCAWRGRGWRPGRWRPGRWRWRQCGAPAAGEAWSVTRACERCKLGRSVQGFECSSVTG
jgi:hypothetical protein